MFLFGWVLFWFPGIGPLLVTDPLVSTLLLRLEGAVAIGGLSALEAGINNLVYLMPSQIVHRFIRWTCTTISMLKTIDRR